MYKIFKVQYRNVLDSTKVTEKPDLSPFSCNISNVGLDESDETKVTDTGRFAMALCEIVFVEKSITFKVDE